MTACSASASARGARSTSSSSRRSCARPCRRRSAAWFREELLRLGLTAEQADQRVADLVFAFEPGDLIAETMSLGALRRSRSSSAAATLPTRARSWTSSAASLTEIESLRDVQIQQSLHYPTVQVSLDRERAGLSGVTARDIGESLIAATYSSRYTTRNYWRDDVSGNSYQVQVQVPPPKMTDATDVGLVPLTTPALRQAAAQDRISLEPRDARCWSATWPASCGARCPARSTATT